jgi:hypothetical protein
LKQLFARNAELVKASFRVCEVILQAIDQMTKNMLDLDTLSCMGSETSQKPQGFVDLGYS